MTSRARKMVNSIIILVTFVAILVLGRQAEASEYLLTVTAEGIQQGDTSVIGMVEADSYDACVYNIGLVAGAWYAQGLVDSVTIPYTRKGGRGVLAFITLPTDDTPYTFMMVFTCALREVSA